VAPVGLLKPAFASVVFEPFFLFFVIGHGFFDQSPKCGRVVLLDEVGEFVDAYIVEDVVGREEQAG